MILLVCVIAAAVLLLVLGFLAPRLSRKPQGEVDKGLDKANQQAQKAPGPLDKMMDNSTKAARKVADSATEAGREARYKSEE
jgi:F0F1-type ATP synthase membrane subunit b/b'